MSNYKDLVKRASTLDMQLRAKLDRENTPEARELKERAHHLKEFMEGSLNASSASDQAKHLADLLSRAADMPSDQAPMDTNHADDLHNQYLRLKEELRRV